MKLMVISIFIFLITLLFPTASSLEFDFDSPNSIDLEEVFTVNIKADTSQIYDVKILVHNSSDDKITSPEVISVIEKGGKWQSPWNYLISSFPSKTSFRAKVIEQPGNRKICVRLRKNNASSFNEVCKSILVNDKISEKEDIDLQDQSGQDNLSYSPAYNNIAASENIGESEIIILNKLSLNNPEKDKVFRTKEGKFRLWLIAGLSLFCLMILILLALRKL